VLRDGKLYGRGGADDGYALFASLTALRMLHEQRVPHARAVILIEASEESGKPGPRAPHRGLGDRLGTPTLVVCLDAECGNYDQLWATTSLRGNLIATLRVDVLTEGVHSGRRAELFRRASAYCARSLPGWRTRVPAPS